MKAILYTEYGGPEMLRLADVAEPSPADDEVLVKVVAVSLNDWDWGKLSGDLLNRMMSGWKKPRQQILGSDIAGVVEAVGRNVIKFQAGDAVFGDLSGKWGGLAEFVCAPEKAIALKPPVMSFVDAAAIPQAGMLAVQGLIDKGKLRPGQKVLINGAGGGVGTLGVQIAKTFGAEVTGVDTASKLDMMRSVGFDHVIDYTKEDFTKNGKQYHLILDVKTNRPVAHYARALLPGGIYVTVGGSIPRLLQALIQKSWIRAIKKKHVAIVALKPNKNLAYMSELYEKGKLKPVIDGPYTLEQTPDAFRLFETAGHKGKIVITI